MRRRDLRREADHVNGHAVEFVQRVLAGPGVHLARLHRKPEPAGVEGDTAHRVGDRNSGMIDAAPSPMIGLRKLDQLQRMPSGSRNLNATMPPGSNSGPFREIGVKHTC